MSLVQRTSCEYIYVHLGEKGLCSFHQILKGTYDPKNVKNHREKVCYFLSFFCYSAADSSAIILGGSSYSIVSHRDLDENCA